MFTSASWMGPNRSTCLNTIARPIERRLPHLGIGRHKGGTWRSKTEAAGLCAGRWCKDARVPAYLIVEHTITDPAKFQEYGDKVRPLIAKYGGLLAALRLAWLRKHINRIRLRTIGRREVQGHAAIGGAACRQSGRSGPRKRPACDSDRHDGAPTKQ